MSDVSILDYGMSNLLSIQRGFEKVGASVEIVSSLKDTGSINRLVIPGVGAFKSGMEELRNRELESLINEVNSQGKPILGVCLGMQLMTNSSIEKGLTTGLELVNGDVIELPNTIDGKATRVPHMGWSAMDFSLKSDNDFFSGIRPVHYYFVHSYYVDLHDSTIGVGHTDFSGKPICVSFEKENCIGTQFHPEKSGEIGLSILDKFKSWG